MELAYLKMYIGLITHFFINYEAQELVLKNVTQK